MLPVVALVGRPNVGKSTLFNRLTNTRDALVADFPGLTRDRKYGPAKFEARSFIVVDTGGITGDEEGIDAAMAEQSLLAIDEADVVLFLVDARAGLTPDDIGIAEHLRKQNKAMYLVANKVDGIDGDSESADFYKLGFNEVLQIAAAHGRGVSQLMTHVLEPLAKSFPDMAIVEEEFDEEEDAETKLKRLQDSPIKLAIVGKPNVGKSTLTNRILGEDRVVVYDQPGTTRDSIFVPMEREGREYVLIDTAGVRKRKKISEAVEKFSIVKTLQAIEEANVVLLVIDAREGITDQDLSLLGFVLNSGRSLVLAVNKWDGLEKHVKEEIKRELDRRLGFVDFARLHFISALHGTGVGHLFESVQEAYASATQRINTSMLTQIMEMAQVDHQPPLLRGRRVKMKYAHAGGYNPPVIVIHGNQVSDLPESYKRYLMNYYRKALKTMGTPIRIEFKEGANPFEGKKNKLTLAQERKRKRLMTFHKKK
ncbi:ribosome biogenesis GTPase Der [Glaciecola sp. MH2013]|uniref:ribosome biogenesis GTPase Der n=1 Tax=Glaciecola sp. MH2013 TaxID=2785524 RepID=UPI00189E5BF2|nr:ribosome biogenesis GTPase Der [Glaciecola sp. MH2013]MBF7074783.1 ribosome biogenesis GTPase Der [Glaciecola sp. MH2013]